MDRAMHRTRSDFPWVVASMVGAVLLAPPGCGKGRKGPVFDLTPVSGTVTLDGKPLADADVGFYLQGTAPAGYFGSGARTDAHGKYQLLTGAAQGAVPGSYKVTVSRITDAQGGPVQISEGLDLEQLKMQGQAQESLAPKYSDASQTELTTTVEQGKADGYNFELKSS